METHNCAVSVEVVRVKEEPDWGLSEDEPETDVLVPGLWVPEEFKEEPVCVKEEVPSWDSGCPYNEASLNADCEIKNEPTCWDSVDSNNANNLDADHEIKNEPTRWASVDSSNATKYADGKIKNQPTCWDSNGTNLDADGKIKNEPTCLANVDSSGEGSLDTDREIKNARMLGTAVDSALNASSQTVIRQIITIKPYPSENSTYNRTTETVSCKICNRSFKDNRQLIKHHNRIHEERRIIKNKPFHCVICKKQFSQLIKFTAHLQTHASNLYTCEICRKKFTRNNILVKHNLTHDREKPHCCELCGERFVFKIELLRHKLNHTRLELTCDACENHPLLINSRHKRINILRR